MNRLNPKLFTLRKSIDLDNQILNQQMTYIRVDQNQCLAVSEKLLYYLTWGLGHIFPVGLSYPKFKYSLIFSNSMTLVPHLSECVISRELHHSLKKPSKYLNLNNLIYIYIYIHRNS